MNHLNFFHPYERKKSWHEDALTRAFLVVLKYVPMAQTMFLDMVRQAQIARGSKYVLPPVSAAGSRFTGEPETQVAKLNALDEGVLISVLLSGDPWNRDLEVQWDDERKAVYDGVLYCGDDYILTIENKPEADSYSGHQLHPATSSCPSGAGIQVDPCYVNLTWKDILRRLSTLEQDGLVSSVSLQLLNDFLEFIDSTERLAMLNPFDEFSLCKDRIGLLMKRCRAVMTRIAGEVFPHRGWRDHMRFDGIARRVGLYPVRLTEDKADWVIETALHPADTVAQARTFYQDLDPATLHQLVDHGWHVRPRLHFSHINKNLVWTTIDVEELDRYIAYWRDHPDEIGRVYRGDDDFAAFSGKMLTLGFMDHEEDGETFAKNFPQTQRQFLNVCPGVEFKYQWTARDACELDSKEQFVANVRKKLQAAFNTWGQTDSLEPKPENLP
jgi:hypothetical protein